MKPTTVKEIFQWPRRVNSPPEKKAQSFGCPSNQHKQLPIYTPRRTKRKLDLQQLSKPALIRPYTLHRLLKVLPIIFLVAPWFEHGGEKKVTKKKGEDATLDCSARGFPLNVEWKYKKDDNDEIVSCIGQFQYIGSTLLKCQSVIRHKEVSLWLSVLEEKERMQKMYKS